MIFHQIINKSNTSAATSREITANPLRSYKFTSVFLSGAHKHGTIVDIILHTVTHLEHRVQFVVDNALYKPEIKSTLRKYLPYSQEFSQIICLNYIFVIEISTCQELNFFNDCYTLQNLRFLCFATSKLRVQEIHITSNANIAFVSYGKTDSQQIHQFQ